MDDYAGLLEQAKEWLGHNPKVRRAEPLVRALMRAITTLVGERDALKAAKWDVQHTDTMTKLVQMGLVRDAAETALTEALAKLAAAEAMLSKAANQFAFYADEHAKKGTPDGDAKSMVNHQWALACAKAQHAALTSGKQEAGGE